MRTPVHGVPNAESARGSMRAAPAPLPGGRRATVAEVVGGAP